MAAPDLRKTHPTQDRHPRHRRCQRQLAHPRRPDRLPAPRRRHRPGRRQRPRHHHLRRQVLDAAVEKAYKGKRKIHWFDIHAGDVARAHVPSRGQGRAGRRSQRGRAAPALPARRHAQGVRVLQPRPQGPAHHADRRRLPQHQRLPAHPLRPVRLRPAGPLLQGRRGAEQAGRQGQHGHLPREHRGRVLRHRVQEQQRPGQEAHRPAQEMGLHQRPAVGRHRHQADQPGRDRSG